MSILPDEIWREILKIGVETRRLDYKDLCCFSISSRRLHRLSNDHTLWSILLSLDFPSPSLSPSPSPNSLSPKSLYRTRFERDGASKLLSHRRAVLNVESQIAISSKILQDLPIQLLKERIKMKETMDELANLSKVRQASVALNVWQPEIVRDRQKQIVEQCTVPIEHRLGSLEMELKLCKNQIDTLNKAYNIQKFKLDAYKQRLASLKYHPLRNHQLDKIGHGHGVEQKKLNQCSGCKNSDQKLVGRARNKDVFEA